MKTYRHKTIRDLFVKTIVTSQDELRRKLAARGIPRIMLYRKVTTSSIGS